MKKIFTILAVLAIANLIAIGGFVGWLKATDRLSKERMQKVRAIFAKTVAEDAATAVAVETKKTEEKKDKVAAEKMAIPPVPASEQIAAHQLEDEHKLQTTLRKEQELESLQASLAAQLSTLETREKKLMADKAAFEAQRKKIADTEGTEQFKTALSTLEGQKPKDAKSMLKSLIDSKETEQVVSYLAKMEEGKRTKVMAEFVKDDPMLAADLLERLRTRGMPPPGAAPSSQANMHDSPLGKPPQTTSGPATDQRPATGAAGNR